MDRSAASAAGPPPTSARSRSAGLLVAVGLGVFAPKVETALSGAGWEATGSESVAAREIIDKQFAGLSLQRSDGRRALRRQDGLGPGLPAHDRARRSSVLKADPRVKTVVAPRPGTSISRDGHTAIVQAGAAADANTMVRAADDLKAQLQRSAATASQVSLTGASGMWSDFNEANRTAMMKSELFSWPVTLVILVLAFGSLVAAGLPLMLTILGLMASAGSLYLGTQLLDISIWAMNFALMFALALGIDYALFIVYRFRGAFFGSKEPVERGGGRDDGHGRQGRPVQRPDRADLADRRDARARARRSARWRSGSCSRSSSSSPRR